MVGDVPGLAFLFARRASYCLFLRDLLEPTAGRDWLPADGTALGKSRLAVSSLANVANVRSIILEFLMLVAALKVRAFERMNTMAVQTYPPAAVAPLTMSVLLSTKQELIESMDLTIHEPTESMEFDKAESSAEISLERICRDLPTVTDPVGMTVETFLATAAPR